MIDLNKKEYPAPKKVTVLERVRSFALKVADKLESAANQNKEYKLTIEKWKCVPHDQSFMPSYVSVFNDDIESACRVLESVNGRVVELVKKSDTEYKVTFKNKRVYKMTKYF